MILYIKQMYLSVYYMIGILQDDWDTSVNNIILKASYGTEKKWDYHIAIVHI